MKLKSLHLAAMATALMFANAQAAVDASEAAQLKTTLTPFGAERAGNKEGTIPAWTGAVTPGADIGADGLRGDPFANEKPLYSVTAKNMEQYAAKLTEGTKALLKRYPNTFRVDVYPTRRTAVAPQWAYDAVAKNAVSAKLVEMPSGSVPENFQGPIPFPIPKSGVEVVWNHQLRWRQPDVQASGRGYQSAPNGSWILINDYSVLSTFPYLYQKEGKFTGEFFNVRQMTTGPALRAGEAIVGRNNLDDDKTAAWVYLPGQRRVRKLPNPCCDTPSSFSAGISTFDEVNVFNGRTNRFDWKLVGKQEMLVPYNNNKYARAKDKDLQGPGHLNPDYIRWELHRVWVVEATLRQGQRHTSPKTRYYFDEDTWTAIFADRYDANGQLARIALNLPAVATELPGVFEANWGVYDLISGSAFFANFIGEKKDPFRLVKRIPDSAFTPDALAGEGVR